jgi:predicted DNA-binding transcriptional regulator AlpA
VARRTKAAGALRVQSPLSLESLWRRADAAAYLCISIPQFDRLVRCGRGPKAIYLGSVPRWRPETVRVWVAALEGGQRFSPLDATKAAAK